MKIELDEARLQGLRAFLERCEDAEQLSEREYVVDLYDIQRPITLNLVFVRGGIGIDGAAELKYDDEQNGWYMGERLADAGQVLSALEEAGAWQA